MKSRWLFCLGLLLGACVLATPARANLLVEVIADCENFQIIVSGRHWECWRLDYTFYLEEAGGGTTPVSGYFLDCPGGPDGKDVLTVYNGSWGGLLCGTFKISMDYIVTFPARPDYLPQTGSWGSYTIDCPCGNGEGTGTPGYWMNHPEAWPVAEITIGCVTYSQADAIAYMMDPVEGDKTFTLFPALVAAKLNILIGTDPSCIADVIAEADAWMCLYGPVGSGVAGRSDAWDMGEPLYELLDKYNNGELCAPFRDDLDD